MGGKGGKRGGSKGGYKGRHAKTALSKKKARQAASKGYAPAGSDPGNLARAAVAHGDSGWGWASDAGYDSYAQPRDQIPGTAEYAQRVRKEEAKEKVTKAESGFGDTLKKALSIASFATAPGILSGLNLAKQFGLGKDSTDYSKAFAPGSDQSIANTWSPQNLSKIGFGDGTMDPGDWNQAMDNTVNPDLPGAGFGMSQELRKIQKALSDPHTPKDALPGLQKRMFNLQHPGLGLVNNVDWTAPTSYNVAESSFEKWQRQNEGLNRPDTNYNQWQQQHNELTPFSAPVQKASADWGMGGDTLVSYAPGSYLNIGSQAPTRTEGYSDKNASVYNSAGLNDAISRLSAQNPAMAKASDRNWNRGLGTDTRAVRSATARGGGARPLPTLASQAPALKAAQDQQAQAGNLTISDYLKQAQDQSAQNRSALAQLQTGRTDLTAQIEALKKQYGEDVDLTGLQNQSGEYQTAIDQRTADLSSYDQAVRGNVVRQQQMWATPQRTWGVKARTSEYKSPLQQFGRRARQETKKIQTQTPTISNLAATWGNLPVLNV